MSEFRPPQTMSFQLTAGIVKRLGDTNSVPADVLESQPTVQFLAFKKVALASEAAATMDRYCVIMSDGQHFLQSMIATLLNEFIETGQVGKHSVAVIERIITRIKHFIVRLGTSKGRNCDEFNT
ncbi:uncharacterized protein LAESUDRAFT_714890 [Laetiporus sulphureus 93-53]|uniref:Replication factor-A protein 1 N-terminal domain-containing protein n=1 Tax=Laetiporus sulphureus 93-53 TaxID=1314785 RepID=A0A165DPE9_9APHY|nr:uncharacterized protein LAESUDRAFT_714890 [Laetiporus sulphureus 93-53]KZT05329.1 hypothetical protein LAESUDRAFT_714890 [Laetiporus sulphureus 93-53]